MRSSKADSKTTHNALPKRSSSRGPAPARKESGRSVVQSLATWTSRTAIGLMLIHALSAATSDAATLPFTGTLSVTVGDFGSTSVTGSGTGTSVRVGHILDSADIPANVFQTNQSNVPVLLNQSLHGGVTFGGFAICAPGFKDGTTLTVPSIASACPSPGQNAALSYTDGSGLGSIGSSAYLTNTAFQSVAEIPLSVVGNDKSATGNILLGLIDYTVKGNPWTPSAITSSGVLNGATTVLTATGFDDRSITNSEGTLKLVTSAHITWSGAVAGTTPVIATMTLDFGPPLAASAAAMTLNLVPEPGTALLLGSGIAGLVVLGRRRTDCDPRQRGRMPTGRGAASGRPQSSSHESRRTAMRLHRTVSFQLLLALGALSSAFALMTAEAAQAFNYSTGDLVGVFDVNSLGEGPELIVDMGPLASLTNGQTLTFAVPSGVELLGDIFNAFETHAPFSGAAGRNVTFTTDPSVNPPAYDNTQSYVLHIVPAQVSLDSPAGWLPSLNTFPPPVLVNNPTELAIANASNPGSYVNVIGVGTNQINNNLPFSTASTVSASGKAVLDLWTATRTDSGTCPGIPTPPPPGTCASQTVEIGTLTIDIVDGPEEAQITFNTVPEPATALLVTGGMLGLAVSRRRAGVSA